MNQKSPIDDTDGVKAQGSTQRRQTHAQKHSEQKKNVSIWIAFSCCSISDMHLIRTLCSALVESTAEKEHTSENSLQHFIPPIRSVIHAHTHARAQRPCCALICVWYVQTPFGHAMHSRIRWTFYLWKVDFSLQAKWFHSNWFRCRSAASTVFSMSRTLHSFHPYPPNRLHMAENSSDTEIWDRFYHQTTPSSLARNKEDEKEMRDRGQRGSARWTVIVNAL